MRSPKRNGAGSEEILPDLRPILFIDANLFRSFCEATNDSLLELDKLITVLKQKKWAKFWPPDQIKRKVWKNRDSSVVPS